MSPELPRTPEEFVPLLLQSFVTQTGGYFVVVGALFLVFWVWGARVFAARKIQRRRRVDGRQVRFELLHTVGALFAGTVTAGGVMALYASGHSRLTPQIDEAGGPVVVVAVFVAFLAFNDLWFYGWHRLLHTPWWFRRVHAVHHKSVDVSPFSSYSFHPFEAFIFGAWIVPAVLVVPVYLPALGLLQLVGLANNVMSHLGYELLPRWWVKVPILRWSNTATFHNLHHSRLNGNYGLHSRVWDRLFGTEVDDYAAVFVDRGGDVSATAGGSATAVDDVVAR